MKPGWLKPALSRLNQDFCFALRLSTFEPLISPLQRLIPKSIDCVIFSGESGPGAKSMYKSCALNIRCSL